MSDSAAPARSKTSIWIQAVRAFAFPATFVSVVVAGALALSYKAGPVNWWLFPVCMIAGILYHMAANVISDVFDFKRKVDKDYTFGSSGVLTGGLLTPREAYLGGLAFFAVASALGLILVYFRGWPMLAMGVAGLLGAYFYCANPVGYKYIGLGDFAVFLFFGTGMTIGTFYALTGDLSWAALAQPVWVSIPLGALIAGILSANNVRDIKHDTEAGIITFESALGISGAKILYSIWVLGAYLSVPIMAYFGVIPWWTMVVFLSLPLALKNVKAISGGEVEKPEKIAAVDVATAQLHTAFGALFAISIAVSAFIK
ncbi:MAG: 1,4-dihydroxy-2-naphthoate octaprenyltransferase [bacterium]|jgi:1,4-dihydroxy-2-naphthoate octaprenyltransferase